MVTDETNGSAQDKEPIETSKIHQFTDFLARECSTRSQHVHKTGRNATIHIENEIGTLLCGDFFNPKCKVQNVCVAELFFGKILNQHNTLVWVCERFHSVANAHDEFVAFLHVIHESLWAHATVKPVCKHFCCLVQSSSKSWPNCKQTTAQCRHQIFASTSGNDCVVCSAHSRTMICCDHEYHFNELGTCSRQ